MCKRCNDSGLIKVKDNEYVDGFHYEVCGCSLSLETIGIPELFRDATFDDFVDRELVNWFEKNYIKNFQLDKSKGIYLYGSPGTGKTYLSVCLVKELSKVGIRCLFIPMIDFIDKVRNESFKLDEENVGYEIKTRNIEFLVLDDFGSEKLTEWVEKLIHSIVDYRYRRNLPTIFTSNYSLEEMLSRFHSIVVGERIISRIRQVCYVVDVGKENFRWEMSKRGFKNGK